MDKPELIAYLEGIDRALRGQATLYIYGSAACILLGEPDRTSLDVDVAGPYSVADQGDLREAAETVGLPINPADDYGGDHIEWVGPPSLNQVWHRLKTGNIPDLDESGDMLDTALLLHQALPSEGYASRRALNRLALYQAKARAFGTVQFLKNIRHHLGRAPLAQTAIPGHLVRDIGLPRLSRGVRAGLAPGPANAAQCRAFDCLCGRGAAGSRW